MVWFGMILVWYWYGTGMVLVWYWYGTGMVWYGMVRYDMVWYGMVCMYIYAYIYIYIYYKEKKHGMMNLMWNFYD